MAAVLRFEELQEFSKKNEELGRKAFLLDVFGERFGFLYINPVAYTLAWSGSIDFGGLHTEALYNLPRLILLQGFEFFFITGIRRIAVTVSFILNNDNSKLEEYHLENVEQWDAYMRALERPRSILFARYDIHTWEPEPSLIYSFTAENSKSVEKDFGELAIKLPKSQQFSELLLEWIIHHHSEKVFFDRMVDRGIFIDTLSNRITSSSRFSEGHHSGHSNDLW
jgi:hypothetical protein